MIIILDMDDVLCHFVDSWLDYYNACEGGNCCKDDIKGWDMGQYVPCGSYIYEYLYYPDIYINADPNKQAQQYTKTWLDEGHEIIVATRVYNDVAAKEKVIWMREHFPHLANRMHIVTGDTKHYLRGDLMVDDAIHNLEHFDGYRALFTQPWNTDNAFLLLWDKILIHNQHNVWLNAQDVIRVNNFKDIDKLIVNIKGF